MAQTAQLELQEQLDRKELQAQLVQQGQTEMMELQEQLELLDHKVLLA
jgi:hypothetical protein